VPSRTTTSVRSVATPEDFFGHDTQIMPSGPTASRQPPQFAGQPRRLQGE
jgi:hypothetical protein